MEKGFRMNAGLMHCTARSFSRTPSSTSSNLVGKDVNRARPISDVEAVPRDGATLIELVAVVAVISLLIGILLPAIQQVRESARRLQCKANLKQIGIALESYFGDSRVWPSASGDYPSGWVYGTLSYLDQKNLFDEFDPNQTWDVNALPTLKQPQVFRCPSIPTRNGTFEGLPVSAYGFNTLLLNQSVRSPGSKLVTVTETQTYNVIWIRGEESTSVGYEKIHGAGGNVLFSDGHVDWIRNGILLNIVFDPFGISN
jgi:prepilin-type processing-associated H-X9-DG protein